MKSLKSISIILVAFAVLTRVAEASVIFSHAGNSDPTTEGWVVEPSIAPGGRPTSGGITDDVGSGFNAWFIDDDLQTIGSNWFYTKTPTPAENNQAVSFGWTLRARLRVVDAPDLVGNAGAIILEYADGTTDYRMALGAEADGDPIVLLWDGGTINGGTEATGASFTLDGGGDGYHLYEMVFDPAAGSVDLFVDGVERLSDYTGVASTLFDRVAWGSASSFDTGQSNWNLVEWDVAPVQSTTSLRMQTDLGGIDIELFGNATPLTVTNFLNYVNDADYDGSFVHRSSPGFVLQMGGFVFDPDVGEFFIDGQVPIPEDPPVVNEPGISNVRATIAMAKIPARFDEDTGDLIPGTGPDSATTQFFFNLADNAANLDFQNGGFTVFGQVSAGDMAVIDAIAALPRCRNQISLCGVDNLDIPIVGIPPSSPPLFFAGKPEPKNLVVLQGIGQDGDGDGIIDRMEDGVPNSGDGNNDTINDRNQAGVASFKLFTGEDARLEVPAGLSLSSTDVLGFSYAFSTYSLNSIPAILSDFVFDQGYFGFEFVGEAAGGSATATLVLPDTALPDIYFNYGPTSDNPAPHWYEFLFDGETGAEINGNTVTLHYVDGKRGDVDLIGNNGIIATPGGPAVNPNGDIDGIPDAIEDGAPNNGDGNNDGIPDRLQSYVGSLIDIRGEYVTVVTDQKLLLAGLAFTDRANLLLQSDSPNELRGLNFVHGFLSMEVRNVTPGDGVDIQLIFPASERPVKFFKYGPTRGNPVDHLYEFKFDGKTGAESNSNKLILHFVDGQRGDSDLTANGIITDPGAPALKAGNSGASGGGGGGGCSLYSERRHPGNAGDWLLLFTLMTLLYLRTRKTCFLMAGRTGNYYLEKKLGL